MHKGKISISKAAPLDAGTRRLVFSHPDDSKLLIKVFRPDRTRSWLQRPARWHYRFKRFGILEPFFQEVREHFAVLAAEGSVPKHMQRVVGFVDTDLGFGLCYTAVRGADGALAPSLTRLIEAGEYDARSADAVEVLKAWLKETPIVLEDLTPGNVVLYDAPNGERIAVLVDGIGDRSFIPIKGMLRFLNVRRKKQQIAKFDRLVLHARTKAMPGR